MKPLLFIEAQPSKPIDVFTPLAVIPPNLENSQTAATNFSELEVDQQTPANSSTFKKKRVLDHPERDIPPKKRGTLVNNFS